MSDQDLRTSRPLLAALLLLVLAAGCGNGEAEREPPAGAARGPEAGPPLEIRPLSDVELMGIDRTQIVLNLPWSGNVLAKEPAAADSGLVRLAELRAPPRLAVDVMHPASAGGAPAP